MIENLTGTETIKIEIESTIGIEEIGMTMIAEIVGIGKEADHQRIGIGKIIISKKTPNNNLLNLCPYKYLCPSKFLCRQSLEKEENVADNVPVPP